MSAKTDKLGNPLQVGGFFDVRYQIVAIDPTKKDNDVTVVTEDPMFYGGGKTCVVLSATQGVAKKNFPAAQKPAGSTAQQKAAPKKKSKAPAKATATTTTK